MSEAVIRAQADCFLTPQLCPVNERRTCLKYADLCAVQVGIGEYNARGALTMAQQRGPARIMAACMQAGHSAITCTSKAEADFNLKGGAPSKLGLDRLKNLADAYIAGAASGVVTQPYSEVVLKVPAKCSEAIPSLNYVIKQLQVSATESLLFQPEYFKLITPQLTQPPAALPAGHLRRVHLPAPPSELCTGFVTVKKTGELMTCNKFIETMTRISQAEQLSLEYNCGEVQNMLTTMNSSINGTCTSTTPSPTPLPTYYGFGDVKTGCSGTIRWPSNASAPVSCQAVIDRSDTVHPLHNSNPSGLTCNQLVQWTASGVYLGNCKMPYTPAPTPVPRSQAVTGTGKWLCDGKIENWNSAIFTPLFPTPTASPTPPPPRITYPSITSGICEDLTNCHTIVTTNDCTVALKSFGLTNVPAATNLSVVENNATAPFGCLHAKFSNNEDYALNKFNGGDRKDKECKQGMSALANKQVQCLCKCSRAWTSSPGTPAPTPPVGLDSNKPLSNYTVAGPMSCQEFVDNSEVLVGKPITCERIVARPYQWNFRNTCRSQEAREGYCYGTVHDLNASKVVQCQDLITKGNYSSCDEMKAYGCELAVSTVYPPIKPYIAPSPGIFIAPLPLGMCRVSLNMALPMLSDATIANFGNNFASSIYFKSIAFKVGNPNPVIMEYASQLMYECGSRDGDTTCASTPLPATIGLPPAPPGTTAPTPAATPPTQLQQELAFGKKYCAAGETENCAVYGGVIRNVTEGAWGLLLKISSYTQVGEGIHPMDDVAINSEPAITSRRAAGTSIVFTAVFSGANQNALISAAHTKAKSLAANPGTIVSSMVTASSALGVLGQVVIPASSDITAALPVVSNTPAQPPAPTSPGSTPPSPPSPTPPSPTPPAPTPPAPTPPAPTPPAPTPPAPTPPTGSSSSSDSDDTGAIVGGVIGGIAGLALLGACVYYFSQQRQPAANEPAAKEPEEDVEMQLDVVAEAKDGAICGERTCC